MNKEGVPQQAIVLSGGGANAAYEVGVLRALLRENCAHTQTGSISPDIYTGTSVGALNAAVMVSGSDHGDSSAVESLERLWIDKISSTGIGNRNGIFRFRGNPLDFANPAFYASNPGLAARYFGSDSLLLMRETVQRAADFFASGDRILEAVFKLADFSTATDLSPLKDLLRSCVEPAKIKASKKKLRITAANWERGVPRTFENRDFDGEDGYQAIAASFAIPGIVPPETFRGSQFVDGAVLVDHPLTPAIAARDSSSNRKLVIHVVYLDPEASNIPLPKVRSTLSSIYRLYVLAFSRSVNSDIERASRINRDLFFLEALAGDEPLYAADETSTAGPGLSSEALKLWTRLSRDIQGKAELEIHRYRSSKHLDGILGLLQFERERIVELIESGYRDTLNHDCVESKCIIPRRQRSQAE